MNATERYAVLAAAVLFCVAAPLTQGANPDALYRDRQDLQSAARAADLWQPRSTTDFDAAWKLARICYWIGTHAAKDAQRTALERGIVAGENAVRLSPDRPEGHFWLAADMGAMAEAGGISAGLKYRGPIKAELQRTLAISPAYEEGSGEAALGRWYATVPSLFGGDKKQAEAHFRRAIAINPESRDALVDLAELLIGRGGKDEAHLLLRRAIDAPIDANWAPEDKETAAHASALLRKLDN